MSEEISEARIKWFKEQNFEITLFPEKTVKKFRDPYDLEKFLEVELEFWKGFHSAQTKIKALQSIFLNAININEEATSSWQGHFNDLMTQLKRSDQLLSQGGSYWCYSATKLGKKLRSVLDEYHSEKMAQAFLAAYFGRDFDKENHLFFLGAVEAYLFEEQAKAHRARFNREKKEYHELHSEIDVFYDECSEKERERSDFFEKAKTEHENIKSDAVSGFEKKKAELTKTNKNLLDRFETEFVTWNLEKEEKIKNLEETYREKLRLSEPVKYWERTGETHNRNGWRFLGATSLLGVVFMVLLFKLLYGWPPPLLESNEWDLNTIKGSLVLLTMTSIGVYVIHLGAKFCISSFHLARDAYERQQLTYVYLALVHENKIDPSEQKIVLQSLFSRADTGLLKGEHAPTMPGIGALFNREQ